VVALTLERCSIVYILSLFLKAQENKTKAIHVKERKKQQQQKRQFFIDWQRTLHCSEVSKGRPQKLWHPEPESLHVQSPVNCRLPGIAATLIVVREQQRAHSLP